MKGDSAEATEGQVSSTGGQLEGRRREQVRRRHSRGGRRAGNMQRAGPTGRAFPGQTSAALYATDEKRRMRQEQRPCTCVSVAALNPGEPFH